MVFGSAYRRPVKSEAAAVAVGVGLTALVGVTLIALGVGCSNGYSNSAWNSKCQQIASGIQTAVADTAVAIAMTGKDAYYHLSNDFLGACLNGLRAQCPDEVSQWMSASDLVKKFSLGGETENIFENSWSYQYRNMGGWELVNKFTVPTGTSSTKYSIPLGFFNLELQYQSGLYRENDRWVDGFVPTSKFITDTQSINWYCPNPQSGTEVFIAPVTYSVLQFIYQSQYGYLIAPEAGSVGRNSIMIVLNQATETGTMGVYNPADKNLYAEGYSVMNHKVDDVINRVGQLQGVTDGINVHVRDVVGTLGQINDQIRSQTQAQVTDVDATDATAAENTATNSDRTTTPPANPSMPDMKVPPAITRKFPFSIPWDLYNAVTVLASPGQAPSWQTHIQNSTIGLDYTMNIDLSPFNALAAVMRWGLSLLFIIGLILVTTKLIKH